MYIFCSIRYDTLLLLLLLVCNIHEHTHTHTLILICAHRKSFFSFLFHHGYALALFTLRLCIPLSPCLYFDISLSVSFSPFLLFSPTVFTVEKLNKNTYQFKIITTTTTAAAATPTTMNQTKPLKIEIKFKTMNARSTVHNSNGTKIMRQFQLCVYATQTSTYLEFNTNTKHTEIYYVHVCVRIKQFSFNSIVDLMFTLLLLIQGQWRLKKTHTP